MFKFVKVSPGEDSAQLLHNASLPGYLTVHAQHWDDESVVAERNFLHVSLAEDAPLDLVDHFIDGIHDLSFFVVKKMLQPETIFFSFDLKLSLIFPLSSREGKCFLQRIHC